MEAVATNKVYWDAPGLAAINAADGTLAKPFQFLQQVFTSVYKTANILESTAVTVKVALKTGDHYFFACHNDLYSSYS